MKVQELIDKLSKFKPTDDIRIQFGGAITDVYQGHSNQVWIDYIDYEEAE